MLGYVLAGLALGSIYAIASASLVVTFVSSGVLNFSFAAMAYTVARFYFYLNSQHGWGTDTAGVVSLLVFAPALGVALYFALFRFLRGKSSLTKLVATIGLYVALPALMNLWVGDQAITTAPGLAALTDKPYHFFGTPVTTDQVITYGFLVFVVLAGTLLLRRTDLGLKVRATVDSEALVSLSGTNPGRVAVGVWAVTTSLAGLAGILAAPSQELSVGGMTALMAAAFAPVLVARLRSLAGAVAAALAMGVVTDVIQKYLPVDSSWTATIVPSIPFAFMFVALVVYTIRYGSLQEDAGVAGPLDKAVKPANEDADLAAAEAASLTLRGALLAATPLVVVALLPLLFKGSPYWLGLIATGLCYSLTFLTFTLVTGEGGMLWLSQISFAGAGALLTGQFSVHLHAPVLVAVLMAACVAAAAGAAIGLVTIKLGELYVAIATLTFALLVDGLVFTRPRFLQGGIGVFLSRPGFAASDEKFSYLTLAAFAIFALLTVNLRRSTSGLALRAVRDSATASRTLGLSVLQMKVITGAVAAFVAAVGGGFLAMNSYVAQPLSYPPFLGLVWLAVVVTLGVRSLTAAALAGLTFTLLPGVFSTYVPLRWADVPTILFGLGAISVARHPEGVVAQQARQLRLLVAKVLPG
ncbi:MAG TPA: ABC transporter permease [Mycobacteriales bacterium]|nr:ABC transporter permease [Mycobacteriales bacterium]HWA65086.1 ABC transporter permease [Mycobacteriales bacterium]HWB65235.1 ABC transporter permease [Mycobacteriales bacterium]